MSTFIRTYIKRICLGLQISDQFCLKAKTRQPTEAVKSSNRAEAYRSGLSTPSNALGLTTKTTTTNSKTQNTENKNKQTQEFGPIVCAQCQVRPSYMTANSPLCRRRLFVFTPQIAATDCAFLVSD